MGNSKRLIWPKRVRIWWCPECNVPLLSSRCYKCYSEGFELKLTEPGDARPAFQYDITKIEETIIKHFSNSKVYDKLIGHSKFILLNKTVYLDDMKEIIVDGNRVAQVYYDPTELRWKFRLNYPGAKILIEEDMVETLNVSRSDRGRLIFKASTRSFYKDQHVVLIDKRDNEPLASAYAIDEDTVKVSKWYSVERVHVTSGKSAGWDDVIKANEYVLYKEDARAKKFIHVMISKVDKPVVVSYSGGKDSLTSLYLTLGVYEEPILLFNNTGIELPETIEAVRKAAEKFNLKLVTADAKDAFWKVVEKLGPPGRDYRWCCKVTKLVPLARTIMKLWPSGILNIVGQRAYESFDRAKSPRVWRNKYIPNVLSISPIQDWSQLLVWLYLYKNKLMNLINTLYFKGFDRIGCFMCPAGRLAEFEVVKEAHPEMWDRWIKTLESWRFKIGLGEEWVKYGLWRWITPSYPKLQIGKRGKVKLPEWKTIYSRWIKPYIKSKSLDKNTLTIKLSEKLDVKAVINQISTLGFKTVEANRYKLKGIKNGVELNLHYDGIIAIKGLKEDKLIEEVIDVLKLYYRALYCAKCRSCETWCPTKAIKVDDNITVDDDKCIGCRICIDVCPVSDVVVEMLIASQVLDDVRACKRRGKRKREDIVEAIVKMSSKVKGECV